MNSATTDPGAHIKKPISKSILDLLRRYESPNVTYLEPDGTWPIVWERAHGVHVWDAEGKRYLDLTAAFGVAATGHGNARVVRAGQRQMGLLLHAMGDVHPHARKAEFARELSRLTFERWKPSRRWKGKTIFCNSGFEAVEAALKTAKLATGKAGVIAFEGAYHGLGYGALNATHRNYFRSPFREQLREFAHFVTFPRARNIFARGPGGGSRQRRFALADNPGFGTMVDRAVEQIRTVLRRKTIGAVLVEPAQVRGGINIPPSEFLPQLRRLCDEFNVLLILDEIYTGFGRTGRWFACEHSDTVPDLICLGKALTGGFPLSSCVGRADIMDAAWPVSTGEAIHTSTFLGHPVGCAMALAQLKELETRRLVQRSAENGKFLLRALQGMRIGRSDLAIAVRGIGLLAGVELRESGGAPATSAAIKAIKALLARGYIFLPEGEHSNVISFSPPLTISRDQLRRAVLALEAVLA